MVNFDSKFDQKETFAVLSLELPWKLNTFLEQ